MRRSLMVGLSSTGLVVASLPGVVVAADVEPAAEAKWQKVQRCIAQANRELKGTGDPAQDATFVGGTGDDSIGDLRGAGRRRPGQRHRQRRVRRPVPRRRGS